MTTATVYDMHKKKVGEIELPDDVFAAPVKEALIHQAVVMHLANCRQGNANTKTRSEVRGGGKKPYRQKGTGRARHGSSRSPLFVGGGVTFGPRTRDWHFDMPKKQRKAAFRMALSQKNKDGNLFILDGFHSKDGRTKGMSKVFDTWKVKSGIVVSDKADEKTVRSIRNIPNVKLLPDKNLSVYEIVKFEHLFVTKDAVKNIVTRVNSGI